MLYRIGADSVVIFHFCFVAFVVTGGLLVLRWRRVMWAHLPAVAWGVYVEFSHRICPLTPLENHLRELGGSLAYRGSFVDHYIMPVLYPDGLTDRMQVALGTLILSINVICYATVLYRWRAARRRAMTTPAVPEPERPADLDAPAEAAPRAG